MLVAGANSWHLCRSKLSSGRSPCSSVVDNEDRLLVVGGSSSLCGEVIGWKPAGPCNGNISIPGVKGYSNTTSGGSIVFLRDTKELYQVLRNKRDGHDDLFVANMARNGLLNNRRKWWSDVIQWLFQDFWTLKVPMETRDAALASDGVRYVYAVGGFVPCYPSGYNGNWLESAINKMLHREQVSASVRKLDTQSPSRFPPHGTSSCLSWMEVPDLPQGRRDAAAVVCNNYLYVIGGRRHDGKAMSSVVRLDLSSYSPSARLSCSYPTYSSTWEEMEPLENGPRYSMAAVAIHNRYIVVAGGTESQLLLKRLKTVECYDCVTNHWFSLPDMLEARSSCSLSFQKKHNKLIVAGGTSGWGIIPTQTLETLEVRLLEEVNVSSDDTPPQTDTTTLFNNDANDGARVSETRILNAPIPCVPTEAVGEIMPIRPPPTVPVADVVDSTEVPTMIFEEEHSDGFQPLPSAPMEEEVVYRGTAVPSPTSVFVPALPVHPDVFESSSLDRSCVVCLERPKSIAFLCGHQVCLECSPLLDSCHSCRRPIEGRIRLFD